MDDIIEVFKRVLKDGVEKGVSDIHLSVGSPWKYRLNGHIMSLDLIKLTVPDCDAIVKHILSKLPAYDMEELERRFIKLRTWTVLMPCRGLHDSG